MTFDSLDDMQTYLDSNVYHGLSPEAVQELMDILDRHNDGEDVGDDLQDFILSHYSGPLPDVNATDDEWRSFYGSNDRYPFRGYEDGIMDMFDGAYVYDVNEDGDNDVAVSDTDGNGEPDEAIAVGDTEKEAHQAVEKGVEAVTGTERMSTGKHKKDKTPEVTDPMTLSDASQKNILSALLDHKW